MKVTVNLLRWVGILEGLSYLILLGVCMPLKYIWGMEHATQAVGMAHGVLFILYCYLVVHFATKDSWSIKDTLAALIASVLPFGPFVADKKIFARYTV